MFRNLRYACSDYSVTVNDGYLIFRWWLPHPIQTEDKNVPKSQIGVAKRNSQTQNVKSRISIQLSGCDWHYFYNEGNLTPFIVT